AGGQAGRQAVGCFIQPGCAVKRPQRTAGGRDGEVGEVADAAIDRNRNSPRLERDRVHWRIRFVCSSKPGRRLLCKGRLCEPLLRSRKISCQNGLFRGEAIASESGPLWSEAALVRLPATGRRAVRNDKMSAVNAGARAPGQLWRLEIRATLALVWPMVLTNLGQTVMTATDVMIMGRLGPQALAAVALGANLYFMVFIFGLGLMLATSPMMATELGRNRHSVRDIRRTVRQGLWLSVVIAVPIWIFLWNGESILLLVGQEPDLARDAGIYLHWLQWALLPFYGYIVLRSFISALERPGWALVIVFAAVVANACFNWVFVFGHLGFPAMGIAGSGLATTLSSVLMFCGMVAVVMTERQFRRYALLGRFWRADWPRFWGLLRLGLPIAGILAFEVTIFNAAA